MHYWLFKSEPDCFSIDDLSSRPDKIAHWDGVRNYQARNMLRDEIKAGDLVLFYHSSCIPPGIAGIVKVVKNGYPDFTAWDANEHHFDPDSTPDKPRWFMVDVKFVEKFPRLLALDEMKQNSKLKDMQVLRKGNRLSITPVTEMEWNAIIKMVKG